MTKPAAVKPAAVAVAATPGGPVLGRPLEKELDILWKNCMRDLRKHDNGKNKELLRKVVPFLPYIVTQCERDTVDGQDPMIWYSFPFFSFLFFSVSLPLSLSLSHVSTC